MDKLANAYITLDTPIKLGDKEVTELTLRRPYAGELRGIAITQLVQMETGALITLTPRIATPAITEAHVAKMDPADLVQIGMAVATFLLPKSELTGLGTVSLH